MEKLSRNFHVKLQEMCDCYLDTNYLEELNHAVAAQSAPLEEEAMKYLALSILYTLTIKAQQLSVKKKQDALKVTAETRDEKKSLPPPPGAIADKMFEIIRSITHIENDKGEVTLALGIRDDQVEIQVKVKRKEDEESMKLLLPELGG